MREDRFAPVRDKDYFPTMHHTDDKYVEVDDADLQIRKTTDSINANLYAIETQVAAIRKEVQEADGGRSTGCLNSMLYSVYQELGDILQAWAEGNEDFFA